MTNCVAPTVAQFGATQIMYALVCDRLCSKDTAAWRQCSSANEHAAAMQSKAVVLSFVCVMHAVAVLNQTLLLCSILLIMFCVTHDALCAGD